VHRRTVREALASAVPPPHKAYARRTRPAINAYVVVTGSWLLAGRDVPRKQRHTARRVWQRLVAEHGVTCAEVTVSRAGSSSAWTGCRSRWQTHPPGAEAVAGFGEFYATIAGALVKAWMFVMRLSHRRQGVPRRIGYPGAGGFSWKGTYWRSSTSARCQPTVATSSNL
jgi:hypothetical protein